MAQNLSTAVAGNSVLELQARAKFDAPGKKVMSNLSNIVGVVKTDKRAQAEKASARKGFEARMKKG